MKSVEICRHAFVLTAKKKLKYCSFLEYRVANSLNAVFGSITAHINFFNFRYYNAPNLLKLSSSSFKMLA